MINDLIHVVDIQAVLKSCIQFMHWACKFRCYTWPFYSMHISSCSLLFVLTMCTSFIIN